MSSSLQKQNRKLCFDPVLLEGSDFDVQQFVSSIRARVPLSVLRDDLRANLEELQAELVSCVQQDFQTFVSLGPSIDEAEPLARATLQPLALLKADLSALVQSLDAEIGQLDTALERRAAMSARKSELETILRAHELLQKCERLAKSYARLKMSDESLRLAERIATTFAQLEFALSGAGDGAFVMSLAVRVAVVRRDVRGALEAWLRQALLPKGGQDGLDTETLSRALGMHVTAGLAPDAEAFFRREVVVPFAAARLKLAPMLAVAERRRASSSGDATPQGSAGTSGSRSVTAADALECAVDETLSFIGEKVTALVSLVESEERLRTKLDFVGAALWPAIENAVVTHMGAAFSPGIPDVFHKSVLAGTRLYAAMEAAAGTDAARERLAASSTTADFWKRWNLPVYFQLRFADITTAFDGVLGTGPTPAEAVETRGVTPGLLRADVYGVRATAALVAALRRCWAEDVFLPALTHRFVRLSLQLLARYITWVRSGLAGDWKNDSDMSDGAALVYADVVLLQRRVAAELAAVQRKRNVNLSEDLIEEIDATFSEAVAAYAELLPDLARSMADKLAGSCAEILKPLRSVLLTYDMSSKPAPTTHSQFVPKILKPLKTFLVKHEDRLDETERTRIVREVVEQTSHDYYEMATELLSQNKNRKETLRRLNIGRGGKTGGKTGGGGGMIDKISTQLCLDVDRFIVEIQSQGVALEDVPSVKLLTECVKREDEGEES